MGFMRGFMREILKMRCLQALRREEAGWRPPGQAPKILFLALMAAALASCAKAKEFLLKNLEEPVKVETQEEKTSYTAGYLLGGNIKGQQSIKPEAFLRGLKDSFGNAAPLPVSFEEIQSLRSGVPKRFTGEKTRAGGPGLPQTASMAAGAPDAAPQDAPLQGSPGGPAGSAAAPAPAAGSSAGPAEAAGQPIAKEAGQKGASQGAADQKAASGAAAAAKDKDSKAAKNNTMKSPPPAAAGKEAAAAGPLSEKPDENKKFLEQNKTKPGVKTTASGLQYEALREGTGKSPSASDIVEVHYSGALIDGTEFDSSYNRRESATFPLNQVITGWTEGLQLMKEGAKYKFYIPSELGYGSSGSGKIPPNAALIFEVELLKVVSAAAPPAAPAAAAPSGAAKGAKPPSEPAKQPL